jgi:sulfopyruvate decarboxylase TPP-binding subunit
MESQGPSLRGSVLIDAIKQAGVSHVLAVPDLHTSAGLLKPIAGDRALTLIRVCKEDECLGIAAGLSYGGKRALILIQYTGMLYAMNAIRAVALEHSMPICIMVGLLGHQGGSAREAKRLGLRIIEPILDVIGLRYHLVDSDADAPVVTQAIRSAYENSRPIALLVTRRPGLT